MRHNSQYETKKLWHLKCHKQAAALRDSRKKNWDEALKAKKMRPFGRRGKLLVKRTSVE